MAVKVCLIFQGQHFGFRPTVVC